MAKDKVTKKVESHLDGFGLGLEQDKYPKKYVSPTAGTPKRLPERVFESVVKAVKGFVRDIITAIKTILKEVM